MGSHLIHAFLFELQGRETFSCQFDRLDLTGDMFFKRNLDIMSSCIDDIVQDQNKFSFYQRQVARQKQARANQAQKREARIAAGETVNDDDLSKKPLPYLQRM